MDRKYRVVPALYNLSIKTNLLVLGTSSAVTPRQVNQVLDPLSVPAGVWEITNETELEIRKDELQ